MEQVGKRRNQKMYLKPQSVVVAVSPGDTKTSDDQIRRTTQSRKKTRRPVKRVQTITNVTEDAEKVLGLLVKLNRSRSQNDAPQVDNRTWYIGGTQLNPCALPDNNYVFLTANGKPTSHDFNGASRPTDKEASTPYERIDYDKMLPSPPDPNLIHADDVELDGGASSDSARGNSSRKKDLRNSGDFGPRESDAWGDSLNSNRHVSSSTALSRSSSDHIRRSGIARGAVASNSPAASGSEDRLSDDAAARKKKSLFQRAKERIQAGFRRMHGKESAPAGAQAMTKKSSSKSSASGRGLQRMNSSTPSMETRSEAGTSSSLVRRKSSKSSNDQRESKVGFLSRIPQRFGSMRSKSQKSKDASDSASAPKWPHSAEDLGIQPLNERERKTLEKYRPITANGGVERNPHHTSSPYSHAATGVDTAVVPVGGVSDSARTSSVYDRSNLRLTGLTTVVPRATESRGATGSSSFRNHRAAVDGVRLASSEDCSTPPSSARDSLDGGDVVRKMRDSSDLSIDGNTVDDNPSAEYIRPIFERSLAEQEEAFGHVASRLSEIAEEVMKKYSWGGGHSCMAYVDDPTYMENAATASPVAGAEGGGNYLQRLLGSHMDFHEVVNIVSRATSNEPIVMQIALLFGLTSEAIRLVGEATPRANEITRQAMEYFEAQLASDVVQVGGLESIVEQVNEVSEVSEEKVYEYETSV